MSGPFAGTGTFRPTTGEKNAREQLIEFAERHGWLLDITAVRHIHRWKTGTEQQDPNQFVRAANDDLGGVWHVLLDYEVVGDPDAYQPIRKWDNTLRAVQIWHSSDVDDSGVRKAYYELRNYHQSNTSVSLLWDMTDRADGKFKPLRKRAEELLRDPDLLMWCAAERRAGVAFQRQLEREAREERDRQRRRPLPITLSKSEWRTTGDKLRRVAGDITNADGLTDLHSLIKDAEDLLDVLRAGLVEIEPDCFYCGEPIPEGQHGIDPSNQRTYGPCCADHALRFERKKIAT